jgi:hypothetical protein
LAASRKPSRRSRSLSNTLTQRMSNSDDDFEENLGKVELRDEEELTPLNY